MLARGKGNLLSVHASCVLAGASGILIRGVSGSGKSTLALALVDACAIHNRFARLVSDDRSQLEAKGGRLLASCQPAIAGLVERRGLGLTPEAHEPRAVVRLVVDCLGSEPPRMPEPEALVTQILGITLPRIAVFGRAGDAALVLAALSLFQR
jgi:HPr kinase/phosphorylase